MKLGVREPVKDMGGDKWKNWGKYHKSALYEILKELIDHFIRMCV